MAASAPARRLRAPRRRARLLLHLGLLAGSGLMLTPFLWMLSTSLI